MLKILGLDIGTTTISAVVADAETGKILDSRTVKNDSVIDGTKLQKPEVIINTVLKIKDELAEKHSPLTAIGVTGQMHGILYLDKDGEAVSPLYTWQDESGNKPFNGETFASYLTKITGHTMASGFGLVTHFVNIRENNVPENAVTLCTIHDYLVMKLTGRKTPLMHSSDAASLGCFDLAKADFDDDALRKIAIDRSFLPEVCSDCTIVGKDENGVPVSVAIGDNQASVLGSVSDENSILVNIGTGSQVSVITDSPKALSDGEARPLNNKKFILVGAPLCGGRSFALLHKFFTECAEIFGGNKDDIYKNMDKIAEINPDEHSLTVDTRFCGTRKNPDIKGNISGITESNFNPAELTRGFLYGMANELYTLYNSFNNKGNMLVSSGNAVRKSSVLRHYLENLFGMKLHVPAHTEEASFGAAIFASVASGIYKDTFDAAKKMIHYQ
ncbi:MAG: hypothetical protein IKM66_07990 [Clostridia bacterium]|nr:hypothetical protein [Clostridia bacterium]